MSKTSYLDFWNVLVTLLFVAVMSQGQRTFMSVWDLALRWTPSIFEKPQVTYRTQAKKTVGSASMRPLPYLQRLLFDADSEIAPQTINCFLYIGPTTGLCSLICQRKVLPPEPCTIGIMSILCDKHRTTHQKLRVAVKRYAPELQRDGMSDTCLAWPFMWYRIPCIGPTTGGTSYRGGFVMPYCCTTGGAHIALLPNTFQPRTFFTSCGRTTKSQLWPIRHWGGQALPNP